MFVDTPVEVCAERRTDTEKTLKSLRQLYHSYQDIFPNKIERWAHVPVIRVSGEGPVDDAVRKIISQIGIPTVDEQSKD